MMLFLVSVASYFVFDSLHIRFHSGMIFLGDPGAACFVSESLVFVFGVIIEMRFEYNGHEIFLDRRRSFSFVCARIGYEV